MSTQSYILPRVGIQSRSFIETIGFLFWTFVGVKPVLVFLFANNPATGTLVLSFGDAVFFVVLLLAFVSRLVLHRVGESEIVWPGGAKLMFLFMAWAAASLLWTHSDTPTSAVGYWGLMLIDLLIVVLLVRMGDLDVVALRSLQGLVLGTAVLSVLALVFLAHAGARLGDDDLLHPNSVGNYTGVALLCNFYLVLRAARRSWERLFWIAVGMVLLVTLLRSGSKTALGAFAIACFMYFLRSQRPRWQKVAATVVVLVLALVAVPLILNRVFESEGRSRVESFSGRTELWQQTMDMIRDRPLQGYGFLSFRDYGPQPFSDIRVVHAHDEWLNLWFTLGLVGVTLAAASYFAYFRLARRAARWPVTAGPAALAISLLVFALVRGITEAANGFVFPMGMMLLLLFWMAERRLPRGGEV
jgi:exopolysaccharide production protein ExoQ